MTNSISKYNKTKTKPWKSSITKINQVIWQYYFQELKQKCIAKNTSFWGLKNQEHWLLRFEQPRTQIDKFFEEPRLPVTVQSEIANTNIKSRRRLQPLVPTPYTVQPINL